MFEYEIHKMRTADRIMEADRERQVREVRAARRAARSADREQRRPVRARHGRSWTAHTA